MPSRYISLFLSLRLDYFDIDTLDTLWFIYFIYYYFLILYAASGFIGDFSFLFITTIAFSLLSIQFPLSRICTHMIIFHFIHVISLSIIWLYVIFISLYLIVLYIYFILVASGCIIDTIPFIFLSLFLSFYLSISLLHYLLGFSKYHCNFIINYLMG